MKKEEKLVELDELDELDEFAADIYDDAKKSRLLGCLLIAVSFTSCFFLLRAEELYWNILTAFLLVFACVGIVLCINGHRLIRKIRKHTGIDVPMI